MTACIACEKARVNKSSFTASLSNFFSYFFGPRLEYVLERSLQLSLHISKRFNAFQVLKWFLLLLTIDLSFASFFSWISITNRLVEPNDVFFF